MRETILTKLRDRRTSTKEFRNQSERAAHLLAQKTFQFIQQKTVKLNTPITSTEGKSLQGGVVLVPILRAGLAFLPTFLFYFEESRVGFIGLKRDEKTKIAQEYYRNIPKIKANDQVILLDPMLATGGTACQAIQILKKAGTRDGQILLATFISAPEGVKLVRKQFPHVNLITEVIDQKLNRNKFIVPGLGDFGDRYFGTV